MSITARLRELGIALPPPRTPEFNFVPVTEHNGILYLAGHGPWKSDLTTFVTGRMGVDFTLEQGYAAARLTGLNLLSSLQRYLGDLDRVDRVLKLLCLFNTSPDFTDFPRAAGGCSDLFVEVFGERGRHARTAVGLAGLPFNVPVTIEGVIAIRPARAARGRATPARQRKRRKRA